MKSQRLVRVNELIRREIAANMSQFARGTDINLAAVTITRVSVTANLRSAQVWVSVLRTGPSLEGTEPANGDQERQRVLSMLLDRRREIQAHLARTLKIKYTPRLFFEIDDSLAAGDRVLSILNHLEEKHDAPPPPEDAEHA